MMTGRLDFGAAYESVVERRLVESGWCVQKFGTSLLGDAIKAALVRFEDIARRPSLLRWLPDLIVAREIGSRTIVMLVDAKTGNPTYDNFSFERASVDVAELCVERFYTPTFFVCCNGDGHKVLTPREVRDRGFRGPDMPAGSGTPYVLVPKIYGRPFDEIFGPPRTGPK